MIEYLFIESRSALETAEVALSTETAAGLARQGHPVTVFLVQNGVLPARRGASTDAFETARQAGVRILADDFSLRERGIGMDELTRGFASSPLETVVDSLAAGAKTLWH
ncbi:MAG: DsrE family protein [Pseudomonadota bacterium]